MEFLKKHYEKILLSLVLLGLGGAAFWLHMAFQQAEQDSRAGVTQPRKPAPLKPIDLTPEQLILKSATNLQPVVFTGPHNLFNPVTWKRKSNGDVMKIYLEGPEALVITNIDRLYLVITYDKPESSGFHISIQQHSKKRPSEFNKVKEKSRSGLFIIQEAKPAEDPTELVLELTDTKELVTLTKGQPFKKVDGHTVDLKYDPENKTFNKCQLNTILTLSSGTYKIIAITDNEVSLVSNSGKQTTIKWAGTPTP